MYKIKFSSKFKTEYKKILKDTFLVEELDQVLLTLARGEPLATKYRDHALLWKYKGLRECHIKPALLLIYKIDSGALLLLLVRVGSHSDLFW